MRLIIKQQAIKLQLLQEQEIDHPVQLKFRVINSRRISMMMLTASSLS